MGLFDDLPNETAPAQQEGQPLRITVRPGAKPTTVAGMFDDLPDAPSGGKAFVRGVANAATFNFLDELEGLAKAGGADPNDPNAFNTLKGLAVGAYRKFQGDPEAQKLYEEEVNRHRLETQQMEKEHPYATLGGNLAGAVAIPIGAALKAPSLLGRIGRGAAVGAGTGALAGVGEGTDVSSRATRGATGAVLGAGIGAVSPPLVEGAAKGLGAAISKPVNILRSGYNPTGAAERAIGRAANEAATADPAALNRLTQAELTGAGPATVMDTLGQPGRNLARSAGNISGQSRDVLNQTLNPRFEEQVPRLVNWLRTTFHYPDIHAQQAAIDVAEKAINKVNYARAVRDGLGGVWDPELANISKAPPVQAALKAAIKQSQTKSAPDVSKGANAITARWMSKSGKPTLEFWDLVKRQLDQEINVAKRAGRNEDIMDLTSVKNTILEKLDAAVPSYQQARAGAASFFGAENALEAGKKFVGEEFNAGGTRAALAKMSPTERQLFQDGFVSEYMRVLSSIPDRADVVRRIYNTPTAQAKIEIALGPQRAKELEVMLRTENIMQQSLRGVQGNSTTVMQLATAGLAGAAGGGYLGFDPTTSGVASALAAAGKKGIDKNVANKVAEMLTSTDPAVLQRAVKAIAGSGQFMKALRAIDGGAARIGGQQSPKGLLPASYAGRAEEQQPEVPGPAR